MKNSWQIHDNSCLKNKHKHKKCKTMKKEFVSKQDLGVAYFPDADLRYARQKLCEIIHDDHKLMARLTKTGYRKKSKYLSPIQLELIFERLGKPF